MIESLLAAGGWTLVHKSTLPARSAEYQDPMNLPLSSSAQSLLATAPSGIYQHQCSALQAFMDGRNVCLTTGTASGKSLAFLAAGVETLARSPTARVAAIYPLRALAREQEERWRQALHAAGLADQVGRIDGSVPVAQRERILRECRVVLFTPDVLHAWLLGSLSSKTIRSFLGRLRLLVADEVHAYTGVFGSNSAFLYRRLRHAAAHCRGADRLQFVAASATVAQPEEHLRNLFGVDFRIVGDREETSPRYPRHLLMVRPPGIRDLYTEIPELLSTMVTETDLRFLAFVDSRRQTEQLATILARKGNLDPEAAATRERGDDLQVLPYRSGFEEEDRLLIQERLTHGRLRGVISTSALELGLDIPGMDMAILIGVPQTGTSLQQRIGRVGRHKPGQILIIDTGGVTDGAAFLHPESLFDRPLAPTALYLNNPRIQYLHALCFAAAGGEYDALVGPGGQADADIATTVAWPEGFLELCASERSGTVPPELQSMKADAGDDPWHTFPLRDVGSQFRVECTRPEMQRLGSLSHAQLMREAYPGAVYYYMARPYRVTKVISREKRVVVRAERQYTTKPSGPPVFVAPQLAPSRIHRSQVRGDLSLVECDVYIQEKLTGFVERRGPTEIRHPYANEYWQRDRFTRNYASTGVLVNHPLLNRHDVDLEALSRLLLVAFLLVAPFERSDVSATIGRHPADQLGFHRGDRYLTLYDLTYGSLRLSGHLMDPPTLEQTLSEALTILDSGRLDGIEVTAAGQEALEALARSAGETPAPMRLDENESTTEASEDREMVILPGSMGWIITDDNQEFEIEKVYVRPREGLCYRGKRVGARLNPSVEVSFPVANVQPVPGISKLGLYDYETGDVTPLP